MSNERWWHGGPHVRGRWILPPTETGMSRSGNEDAVVFITPVRSLALTYAATCDGWLYEVEPTGPIEADPDSILEHAQSMRCPRARILKRIKPSSEDVRRYRVVVNAAKALLLTPSPLVPDPFGVTEKP